MLHRRSPFKHLAPAAVLVMCDILNPDSTPHATNTRAPLVELLTPDVMAEKPMYGFEQVCFSYYLSLSRTCLLSADRQCALGPF